MKYQFKASTSLLALTAAAALSANPATAADLPLKAYQPAPSEYVSWTGPYVGVHVGGAFDNAHSNVTGGGESGSIKAGSADLSSNNFVVGAHAGFNYQVDRNWVVGIEGDISGLPFNKSRAAPNATAGFVQGSMTGMATLRGRLGLIWDRTLFYVTGGVGWTGMNFSDMSRVPASGPFVNSSILTSGVAGVGFDYKVNKNLTAGVEALGFFNGRTKSFVNSTGRTYSFGTGNVGVIRTRMTFNW